MTEPQTEIADRMLPVPQRFHRHGATEHLHSDGHRPHDHRVDAVARALAFASEETRQRLLVREEFRDHSPDEVWNRITDFQREQWTGRARAILDESEHPR